MVTALHRDFGQSLLKMLMHFERSHSGLATYVPVVKISLLKIAGKERSRLHDLHEKILAVMDKSPFESVQSIAESLRIGLAKVLWHLHDSFGVGSFATLNFLSR
jgi:hypothetical protein